MLVWCLSRIGVSLVTLWVAGGSCDGSWSLLSHFWLTPLVPGGSCDGSWSLLRGFCLCNRSTWRWWLACCDGRKVGLAIGRYSGSSLPCLYRTPQALHSVPRPIGPSLHCGVFTDPQCMQLFPVSFGLHGVFPFFDDFLARHTDDLGASGSQIGLSGGELAVIGLCGGESVTGLTAGWHSGRRRPFLYRSPQAVQTSLRPIGPSLNSGGSDDPQFKQQIGRAHV